VILTDDKGNNMRGLQVYEFPLLLVLFGSPIIIGTVHPPVIIVEFIFLLIAFILFFKRISTYIPGTIYIIMICVELLGSMIMIIQLIPLPVSLLNILSPNAVAIYKELSNTLRIDPVNVISLDYNSTVIELLKSLSCIMLLIMAGMGSSESRRRMLFTIVLSGFTVFMIGIYQKASGYDRLLDYYKPDVIGPYLTSTIVNTNNLSALFGMCSLCSLGIGLSLKNNILKYNWFFIATVLSAGTFLTLSRGGIISFCGGMLFLLVIILISNNIKIKTIIYCNIFIVLLIALLSWLAYAEISSEMETINSVNKITSDKKLYIIKESLKMAKSYWLTGVGKGAFENAVIMFKINDKLSWSHAENAFVNMACEMGIPYSIIFVISFIIIVITYGATILSFELLSYTTAIVFVLLTNLFDYNIEIASIKYYLYVILGQASAEYSNKIFKTTNSSIVKHIGKYCIFTGVLLLPFSICAMRNSITEDTKKINNISIKKNDYKNLYNDIIKRHPADYYLPLIAGVSVYKKDKHQISYALSLLNYSLFLNKHSSFTHLYLADIYWNYLPDKSVYHYKQAIVNDPDLALTVYEQIEKKKHKDKKIYDVVPNMPRPMAEFINHLIKYDRLYEAGIYSDMLLEIYPDNSYIIESKIKYCLSINDYDCMNKYSIKMTTLYPGNSNAVVMAINSLLLQMKFKEAIILLEKYLIMDPANTTYLLKMADIQQNIGEYGKAKNILSELVTFDGISNEVISKAYSMKGYISEKEGKFITALTEYKRAKDLSPEKEEIYWGIYRIYKNIGNYNEAIEILQDLKRINKYNPHIEKEIDHILNIKKYKAVNE
jgi:Tfp pilus assembly protein PilF